MPNVQHIIKNDTIENKILNYLKNADKFVEENPQEWKLNNNVDLEVVNHVLRCKISDNSIALYSNDIINLSHCQNKDGGWGNTRDDSESKVRSTSLTLQMLIRANRILNLNAIADSIAHGLKFILSQQDQEGRWFDPTWHYLDAISVSVGTLLFATNTQSWFDDKYTNSLKKGIEYLKSQRRDNGLWYYKDSGSPVTITAHLLPKCVAYEGIQNIDLMSIDNLIKLQDREGHWDNSNTDHTCDAIRAMMLTASRSNFEKLYNAVYDSAFKAILWLCQTSEDIGRGLGDKPEKPAHVERTCDGIDAMIKFQHFKNNKENLINFWK